MRQVLPWVGAAVGFVVSGFNPAGAQLGFAAGPITGCVSDPEIAQEDSQDVTREHLA